MRVTSVTSRRVTAQQTRLSSYIHAAFGLSFFDAQPLASGLLTFGRSTAATITDYRGVVWDTLPGELRMKGARRVENLAGSYGGGSMSELNGAATNDSSAAYYDHTTQIYHYPVSTTSIRCFGRNDPHGYYSLALYVPPASTWSDPDAAFRWTVAGLAAQAIDFTPNTVNDGDGGWLVIHYSGLATNVNVEGRLRQIHTGPVSSTEGFKINIWRRAGVAEEPMPEYVSRGVPTSYGPELITNGDFELGDATGWEFTGDGALSVDDGVGTYSSANSGSVGKSFTTEVGKTYQITFDIRNSVGDATVFIKARTAIGSGNLATSSFASFPGKTVLTFEATTTTTYWQAECGGGAATGFEIHEASCQEVEFDHGYGVDGVKYFDTDPYGNDLREGLGPVVAEENFNGLVVGSDPADNLENWQAYNTATRVITADNRLSITTAGGNHGIRWALASEVGKRYRLTYEYEGEPDMFSTRSDEHVSQPGVYEFTANESTVYLYIKAQASGAGTVIYDNFKVREVYPVAYEGALLENAATNLFPTDSPAIGDVLNAVGVTDEDGIPGISNNSVGFGDNSINRYLYDTLAVTAVEHTISAYVVMDDGDAPVCDGDTGTSNFVLTVANVICPAPYLVEHVAGSVYRVSAQITPSATSHNVGVNKKTWYADRGFRVAGIQLELGSRATSLIRTSGTAMTRAKDDLSIPSGTTAATLSVVNSEDASHAWALTNDAGGRFVIDENTGVVTLTGEAVGGVYVITAAATGNPSGGVLTRNITIRVTLTETAWLPQMILLMEL